MSIPSLLVAIGIFSFFFSQVAVPPAGYLQFCTVSLSKCGKTAYSPSRQESFSSHYHRPDLLFSSLTFSPHLTSQNSPPCGAAPSFLPSTRSIIPRLLTIHMNIPDKSQTCRLDPSISSVSLFRAEVERWGGRRFGVFPSVCCLFVCSDGWMDVRSREEMGIWGFGGSGLLACLLA